MVTIEKIEEIMDKEVRPYLHSHGGDVNVLGFEDGKLRVKLIGACSGCPGSNETTKYVIEEKIMGALPGVKEVELDQSVDEELLAQARAILSGAWKPE
jgi:Fe-S cluster biogenesis protein NfuA